MRLDFENREPLVIPYIVVLPETWAPHDHALTLLTPGLLHANLAPTGTIAPPANATAEAAAGLPMRMGDDPRTEVKGLFWAGNSGSFMGNVNVAVAQGQMAGFMASEELGKEDMLTM